MQLDHAAIDRILTIVQLLAQGADDRRLSLSRVHALNQNVEALIQHDSDEFVRRFLAAVRYAQGVLTPNVSAKLNRISVAASARGPARRAHTRGFRAILRDVRKLRDWMVEQSEFELPVPVSRQSNDNIVL